MTSKGMTNRVAAQAGVWLSLKRAGRTSALAGALVLGAGGASGCGLIDLAKDALAEQLGTMSTFDGYAATGEALVNTTVSLVCGGSVAAQVVTDMNGYWQAQLDLLSVRFPCEVSVQLADGEEMRSVIDSAATTTVHCNPMTEVVVKELEATAGGVEGLSQGAFLQAGRNLMRRQVGGGLDFYVVFSDPNFTPKSAMNQDASMGDVFLDAMGDKFHGHDWSGVRSQNTRLAEDVEFMAHMGQALVLSDSSDAVGDFFNGTAAAAFAQMEDTYDELRNDLEDELGGDFLGREDPRFLAAMSASADFMVTVTGNINYGSDIRQAANAGVNAFRIVAPQLTGMLRGADVGVDMTDIAALAGGALGQAADSFASASGLDLTAGVLDDNALSAFDGFRGQLGNVFNTYGERFDDLRGGVEIDLNNELTQLRTQFSDVSGFASALGAVNINTNDFVDPFANVQTDFCWGLFGSELDTCCEDYPNDPFCGDDADLGFHQVTYDPVPGAPGGDSTGGGAGAGFGDGSATGGSTGDTHDGAYGGGTISGTGDDGSTFWFDNSVSFCSGMSGADLDNCCRLWFNDSACQSVDTFGTPPPEPAPGSDDPNHQDPNHQDPNHQHGDGNSTDGHHHDDGNNTNGGSFNDSNFFP